MHDFFLRPLNQKNYFLIGTGLALFKYLVELGVVMLSGGARYAPVTFISPLLSIRQVDLSGAPDKVMLFILTWSLPFLAVAMVLSVRRCIDAGLNPWYVLWIACPIFNLLAIVIFCFAPTRRGLATLSEQAETTQDVSFIQTALIALLYSFLIGGVALWWSVYWWQEYGATLFFTAPVLIGAVSSYRVRSRLRKKLSAAVGAAIFNMLIMILALGLFGLEGLVCLVIASPIMFVATILGAILGFLIAQSTAQGGHLSVVLPILLCGLLADAWSYREQQYEVLTAIEIAADPHEVWPVVIAFPDIERKPQGIFAWGVAYPLRARIEGDGIGAMRYCEFSTGDFVEPITTWDAPFHLAFDVTEQPDSLKEFSFFEHIHPPHLDGYLRSHRGEFRLVPLEPGRMRLEGRTWYSIRMNPQGYWRMWADGIIHRIHLRVLDHIRETVEEQKASTAIE
ncbi:MAG: hypothetical protein KF851_13805 [Pirellulaceae bacterium]|nr:hypothetical protein [Pirellulaceae bacterium]